MAKRKAAKSKPKKVAKKRAAKKKASAKRSPAKRKPRKAAAPRKARKAAAPKLRPGVITHTELASANPPATRSWCESVLGWKFGDAMPTPTGPYHMWRFDNGTGGGIRANNPPEVPGSIPYCEVVDIQATYAKAIKAGATEMYPPEQLPGGMGWIAIVAAPGGVAIGFWAMK
jgi:predicted enzyme related to lactoylglutathione lyase